MRLSFHNQFGWNYTKSCPIKFSILKNELMFWMKRSFVRKETNVCFKENMRLFLK